MPPAMAQMAMIPTTTPAAMAAVLDFGFEVADTEGEVVDWADGWPGAVTTTVLAFVIVDGGPLLVGLGVVEAGIGEIEDIVVELGLKLKLELELELELELALVLPLPLPCAFPTEWSVPVKYTDQAFAPPPKTLVSKEVVKEGTDTKSLQESWP